MVSNPDTHLNRLNNQRGPPTGYRIVLAHMVMPFVQKNKENMSAQPIRTKSLNRNNCCSNSPFIGKAEKQKN